MNARRRNPLPLLIAIAVASAACAATGPETRAVPEPIPWADTLPILEPEVWDPSEILLVLREATRDEVASTVSLRRLVSGWEPALNLTASDDVVASAWYEHRVDRLSPADIRRGPPGSPPAEGVLAVTDAKVEGVVPGFTVRDSRGNTYLLKFDPPAYPGMASGADAVSSRLFWAAGYNVPRDEVIHFDPDDLEIDPDAMIEIGGDERPMRQEDVDSVLALATADPDGRYRVLASLFLEGVPKGIFRFEGTRDDDPNDYYPHQHRRELRGLWVVAAWLNHVDLRPRNTLSTFIEPTGYLRHHLLDFSATLGSGGIRIQTPRDGLEYALDIGDSFARLLTLGAHRAGWEGMEFAPIHPSLGWMPVETFDPGEWKPRWPNEAFRRVTPADGYWGAKRVAELDSANVSAAVDAGAYPRVAADTLVAMLLSRRDRILRHWFSEVAPLEEFVFGVTPDSLIVDFVDLAVRHGVRDAAETCYRWELEGVEGDREGRVCDAGMDPGGYPGSPGSERAQGSVRLTLPFDAGSAARGTLRLGVEAPGTSDRAVTVDVSVRDGFVRIDRIRH